MADVNPPIDPRRPPRARQNVGVSSEPPVQTDSDDSAEPRVAITISVADGFRLGCGIILAGALFYAALVVLVALVVGLAMLLNLPLPFGIGGR